MYNTTATWQEAMRRRARPRGHIRVSTGTINLTAKQDVGITAAEEAYYSTPLNINQDIDITATYSTFEGGFFALNGSQYIMPADPYFVRRQGWISRQISDADGTFASPPEIDLFFGVAHTMIGLTLSFDEPGGTAPAQLSVLIYQGDTLISTTALTDLQPLTKAELLIVDATRIILRFDKTTGGYQRARLNRVTFGIGYVYTANMVIGCAESMTVDLISGELPQGNMTIKLNNTDGRFDIKGTKNLNRFFEEGQEVLVEYGLTINDGIEWVPSYKWYLEEWQTVGAELHLKCIDIYGELTKTSFEKSIYTASDRNLNDLLTEVFADAGIDQFVLTPRFLGAVNTTSVPIPIVSHGAAIQILANLGLSRLTQTRDGKPKIIPDAEEANKTFNKSAQAYFAASTTTEVLTSGAEIEYSTFEYDFFALDGSQYIMPSDDDELLPSGFVSKNITDVTGTTYNFTYVLPIFNLTPAIYGLDIQFGSNVPVWFEISSSPGGDTWTSRTSFYPQGQQHYRANYYVEQCQRLQITLQTTAGAYQRFRIKKITPIFWQELVLPATEILGTPQVTEEKKTRDITVAWQSGGYNETVTDIWKGIIDTNVFSVRIEHDPGFNFQTPFTDPSIITTVEQHYAYVSYIGVAATVNKQLKDFLLKGQTVTLNEVNYLYHLNDKGADFEWHNPLLRNEAQAQLMAKWIGKNKNRLITHTYDTRGWPELDPGDIIVIEGVVRGIVIAHEMGFEGGGFYGKETILEV